MPRVFPSIIPDGDEPFVDNSYSREELDRLDRNDLQKLASKVESDEINGKSGNEDIKDYLEGHERL